MTQRRWLTAAPVLLGLVLVVTRASAAIDFSGSWNVQVSGGVLEPYTSHWVVVQTGSQLSVLVDGSPAGGFIDPNTGGFTVNLSPGSDGCSGYTASGTVAGDGLTFTGYLVISVFYIRDCVSFTSDLGGTRAPCGNGVHDPGEECDDGNIVDGDCCSAMCRFETAGKACGGAPPCGDKSCDGAGACQDAPATVCGDTCLPGVCVSGTCTQTPATVDTPCDRDTNACTVDLCDGAGQCRFQGTAVSCPVCQACFPTSGCTVAPALACDMLPRKTLKLQTGDPAHHGVTFTWSNPTLVAFLGNPLATTDYTLCAFDVSTPAPALLLKATAPGGGTCDGKPCWKAKKDTFVYRDRDQTPDGLSAVTLKSGLGKGTSITVKGKGPSLSLPPSFADVSDVLVQVQSNEVSVCYGARYDGVTRNQDSTKLTGHKATP